MREGVRYGVRSRGYGLSQVVMISCMRMKIHVFAYFHAFLCRLDISVLAR